MGVNIKGGNNSAGLANVSSNYELQVVTPQTEADAGFVQISTEMDAGDVLGTRTVVPPECSDDYRLRVGLDQTLFNASFEGTTFLTTTYSQLLTSATIAQANGFLTLNNGSSTTSGHVAYVRTYRHFPTFGTYPTYLDMWIREIGPTSTNVISEWGFLYITTQATQQPIDGIYFRRTSGGSLYGVVSNNSVDIATTTAIDVTNVPSRDGVGSFDPTESNHYLIVYHNDVARFWINDVMVAELACPAANAQFTASSNTPVGFRVLNTGTVSPTARQLSVGFINVGFGDQNVNKPWSHALCGMGAGAYQLQQGNTPGPTVTRASGAAGHPASGTTRIAGTWTATSAPALNNLGGLWTSPAMSSLTTDADYPVFAFLNPAGTAALPGKTLYVTGVRVGEAYVAAAASTNSMFLSYIVAVGNSASATNTADAATTVSGKAITIGGHGFTSTEAVGNYKPGFEMRFDSPLMIPAGHYFHFIVRPFGTVASNTLVVTSSLAVNGYFE
jgi:hypothetical protein